MMRPLALAALCAAVVSSPARAEEVVVFAAASLKTALDEIAAEFQAATGHSLTISYAGSGQLAKQIIEGAPADIFVSAAETWMDAVDQAGLVVAGTRHDLLGNDLVLIAHGRDAAPVEIGPGLDLVGLLNGGMLSMAMVESVPAGQYGKQALETLGAWAGVEPFVAQSENVRAALVLVAAGEAPYGIVYGSDAIAGEGAEAGVTVVGRFPPDSHAPIVYPAALLTGAADAADRAFLDALSGDAADATFAAQGFKILN